MTAPLLEIEDLRVYYRTVLGVAKAVDGVRLTVERGEILGIAGESGCGKSTLARPFPIYSSSGLARTSPVCFPTSYRGE